MNKLPINMSVNGQAIEGLVKPSTILLDFLRDQLLMTGTKKGCDSGECGACTVILDGRPVNSCLVLAVEADGGEVKTIEGLGRAGKPDAIQEAFMEHGAIQCGYCTPGMIMSASSLLDRNPNPDGEQIKSALSGNLCRCGGYQKIIEAVKSASKSRA